MALLFFEGFESYNSQADMQVLGDLFYGFGTTCGVAYGDQITADNLSISVVANSRSYIGFIYDSVSGKYDVVANVSGYV